MTFIFRPRTFFIASLCSAFFSAAPLLSPAAFAQRGSGSSGGDAAKPAVPGAAARQIPERFTKSVFTVVTSKGTATGFILPGQRMVTASRIVEGADAAGARMPAGQPDIALDYLLAFDTQAGFAVLSYPVSTVGVEPLKTGSAARLKPGDKLTVVGGSRIVETTLTGKQTAGGSSSEYLQIAVSLPADAQGSPVLNDKGEVVGVVVAPPTGMTSSSGIALSIDTLLAQSRGVPLQVLRPVAPEAGVFAKVNGEVITNGDYLHTLERQTVSVPNGQTSNAERFVVDLLIGNRVLLEEATKLGVLPTTPEIESFYSVQKKLYENQNPGTSYEEVLKSQGTPLEEVKNDLRTQLAETALYAKRLNITADDVTKAFESSKGTVGVPPRAQLRLIVVAPKSADFAEAQKQLAAKKTFEEVASQFNPPALKSSAGLVAQVAPIGSLPANLQGLVLQSAEGAVVGPIDFVTGANQPPSVAWVKIEKKYPSLTFGANEAAPLIRRQLVQQKLSQPEGAKLRAEYIAKKQAAVVEATSPSVSTVWEALKRSARDAANTGSSSKP